MVTALRINIIRPLILSFILISVFLLTSNVSAEEATSSSRSAGARKEAVQKVVEARKVTIETKRGEMKEKIASREAVLKAKLDAFKNKKKAVAVERINNSLKAINEKIVMHFTKVLARLEEILAKLESRVNSSSPDIKDTVMAKQAISDAKVLINTAKEAVASQSAKDYTITVSTESRIKTDVQKARDQVHTDLTALRIIVNTAKDAVSKAIRIAKSGKPDAKEATASGRQ